MLSSLFYLAYMLAVMQRQYFLSFINVQIYLFCFGREENIKFSVWSEKES